MYLKAVEINGFKSFGDKVYIDFNRGITSIVGPNGSGKSNILDAVLWVLGEQSYKNIRAKESQDVIFSGGKEKKAATKAEVSLIIDNADRYLDLDNDTVKITRRIRISGENEYLINDTKSRLKEIGTLFLDTGIGKTAYSVIGQGKVERIINSSPKEIKNIIEEAAGIKKLQANRIEAQKNLANIEINLDKVEFILNETRENKNKIEKQAELAQKYIDLRDEKSSLAKGIYITELEQKEKTLSENEDIKEKYQTECFELQEKLNKTLERLNTIDLEKEEVKKEKLLIDSRNKELRNIISEKEKEKAVTSERLDNVKKDKLMKEEYILHLDNKIEKKVEEITESKNKKDEISKNILEMAAANKEFENKIQIEGTQIDVRLGIVTGNFLTKNCYGKEKIKRLKSAFPYRNVYKLIAFGDSKGDSYLLKEADESYYKPFRTKRSRSFDEIVRFCIVGVLATALQYGIYLLLIKWFEPQISNTVGYLLSFMFNYIASTKFTFKVQSTTKRGIGFAFAHLVNFGLQTVFLTLFLWLGLPKTIAMIPVFGICVPINFLLVRLFLKRK